MKQNPELKANARELRRNLAPAERILWQQLRGRRFSGYKFRRQQVVGAYILDFYCSAARLALELDGASHLDSEKSDEKRSQWLLQLGIKILRFWNTQVFDELDSVLEAIFRECEAKAKPTED